LTALFVKLVDQLVDAGGFLRRVVVLELKVRDGPDRDFFLEKFTDVGSRALEGFARALALDFGAQHRVEDRGGLAVGGEIEPGDRQEAREAGVLDLAQELGDLLPEKLLQTLGPVVDIASGTSSAATN
jgi:hypothetical protein